MLWEIIAIVCYVLLKDLIAAFLNLLTFVFEKICKNKLIIFVENPTSNQFFHTTSFMRSLNEADLVIFYDKNNAISASLGNSMIE